MVFIRSAFAACPSFEPVADFEVLGMNVRVVAAHSHASFQRDSHDPPMKLVALRDGRVSRVDDGLKVL